DGPFQWRVLACSALSVVVFVCHTFIFELTALVMNHWCLPPDDLGNLTLAQWMNASIPIEEDGSFSQCVMYDNQSAPKNDSIRKIVSCSAWYFDLAEYGNTIISEWSLVCHRSWLVPLASMVCDSGTVVCLPLLGMAADRVGRRPVACACVVALIFTGFASALTKSFLAFVMVRFVLLASASSLMAILLVALHEVTAPAKRVLYYTINAAMAFVLTPVIFILLSLFHLDWMVFHLVLMVPTSLLLATFYVVQESPRWLLATWKLKAAEQVTLLSAKINGTSLDDARQSFNKAAARMRGSITDNEAPLTIALIGLLRQPKHQKNAVLLSCACFAVEFAYTAIISRDRLVSYDWVPIIFLASTVPLYVSFFFCVSRHGRKKVTVALTGLISIETTVLVSTYNDGKATLFASIVLLLVKMSCSAAYTAVFVFTLDLFPTVFRCIGVSTAYACGTVGTLLATLLIEFETTRLRKDLLLLLIALLTIVGALCLENIPETAGAVLFSRLKRSSSQVDGKHALLASLSAQSSVRRKHKSR
ncbi:unnamed protein product, partial [Ixodes hexagonus]